MSRGERRRAEGPESEPRQAEDEPFPRAPAQDAYAGVKDDESPDASRSTKVKEKSRHRPSDERDNRLRRRERDTLKTRKQRRPGPIISKRKKLKKRRSKLPSLIEGPRRPN